MPDIRLWGDSLLLKKVEPKAKGKFEVTGSVDPLSPIYKIAFAGPDIKEKVAVGSKVLLKPGSYEAIMIDGEQYTFALGEQIAGQVGK